MAKPKAKKVARVKDLAPHKAHQIRGGKGSDEPLKDAKDKASGGIMGSTTGINTTPK